MKTCYYEVLGVERKATDEEMKKQYKKMAMKCHPDKNPDDPNATKRFQELNEAYQTLSDPNERAWYDSHRTQILSGKDTNEDGEQQNFGFNVWEFFNPSCYKGFGDDKEGFYAAYGKVFQDILTEEEEARMDDFDREEALPSFKNAPKFGNSMSASCEVSEFYEYWESTFTTAKSFAWADEHKTSKEYERRVNRMIDQDNKKARGKERKSYLDTIKRLVEYVRKRDPRYALILQKLKEDEERKKQEKLEQEEEKKRAKKEAAQRAKLADLERFKELEALKEKQAEAEAEEDELEEFYCAPCEKAFKSENQLKNHEKSKQHLKAVKDLLEQVAMDDEQEAVTGVQKELDRLEKLQKDEVPKLSMASKKKKKKQKKNVGFHSGGVMGEDSDSESEQNNVQKKQEELDPTPGAEQYAKNKDKPSGEVQPAPEDPTPEDQIPADAEKPSAPVAAPEPQPAAEVEEEDPDVYVSPNKAKKLKGKQQAEKAAPKVATKATPAPGTQATPKLQAQAGPAAPTKEAKPAPKEAKPAKTPVADAAEEESSDDEQDAPGVGSRRAKREKAKQKKTQKDTPTVDPLVCTLCGEKGENKTKLLEHLKKKHKLKF